MENESLEMRNHRLRCEMRALDNKRFIASIIFALIGGAGIAAILYWLINYTDILTDLIEKAAP